MAIGEATSGAPLPWQLPEHPPPSTPYKLPHMLQGSGKQIKFSLCLQPPSCSPLLLPTESAACWCWSGTGARCRQQHPSMGNTFAAAGREPARGRDGQSGASTGRCCTDAGGGGWQLVSPAWASPDSVGRACLRGSKFAHLVYFSSSSKKEGIFCFKRDVT